MTRNTGPEAMGRTSDIGHPDELVGTALLLASDSGSYITGQCIIVDGGFVPARYHSLAPKRNRTQRN